MGGVVCLGRPEQASGKPLTAETLTSWLTNTGLGESATITSDNLWPC